jgi:hypothetical protein
MCNIQHLSDIEALALYSYYFNLIFLSHLIQDIFLGIAF